LHPSSVTLLLPSLPRDHTVGSSQRPHQNYSCPASLYTSGSPPSLRKSPLVTQSREGSTPSVGLR
ncbi:unnamed protein product, partial [Ectocarpus fasciculatus]